MAKKRILLVEDEPLLAKGVQRLLTQFEHEVLGPVVDGETAIKYVKDFAPDMALMDITLSGPMDGIEVAEKIRSITDIPIIYLTASSDKNTVDRAKLTEPHGYLLKPFSERELFVTVETALYKASIECRLKESEQRYRSLFEHCPIALFELDLSETERYFAELRDAGVKNLEEYFDKNLDQLAFCIDKSRVAGVNQAALDLFGASEPSEFERDLKRFFNPTDQNGTIEYLKSIAHIGPCCRGSADLKTPGGKSISAVWTNPVPEGSAHPFSQVSVCLLDVTEAKRAQEALARAHQELEIRVQERTEDLCRAVARLHKEMAGREEIRKSLRQRVEELDAINRVSQLMSSSLLPAKVLKFAHDEIRTALEPDVVIMYLYRGDTLQLVEIDSMSLKSIVDAPDEKKIGECLYGLAISERRSQYCLDIHADPRCTLPECKQAGIRSIVTLPLLIGDEVLGVIALGSFRERDFHQHAAFLETIASHLAVALQNAQLHQQVRDAKERLEQRVSERTAELAESNLHLQKEIEERRIIEEALRQSEAKYRAIFDNAAIGIDLVDRDGRFLEANSALCRILGYSPDELNLLSPFDISHPEDAETSKAHHMELVRGDCSLFRLEKRYVRKDKELVWADLSASVIRDQSGQYQATVGVIKDITDRKRYELSQAQLVEEIMNFANIVSHDLRSPLVNLHGFSRELTNALETIRPAVETGIAHMPEPARSAVIQAVEEDVPECLSFMASSVAHMNSQVDGILKLARLGRSELHFEPIRTNQLVEHSLATFAYEINRLGIIVTCEALPDIIGDRTSLDQIMANLIGNAIKYLEPERPGTITIRGERLLEETRFEVRDNGRGISDTDQERIFDIFQRAGRQDIPGEGLGLSCVRTLVRRHGGRVWCESAPQVGSAFFFTIAHALDSGGE